MKTTTKELRQAAYQLGREHAAAHSAAVDTYNAAPPDRCPFKKGTPREAEYDRGWKAQMAPRYMAGGYVDAHFPERPCDKCGKPYRGPAVYCSLTCALSDA